MPVTAGHYNLVLKGRYKAALDVVNSFYYEVDMDGGVLVGDDAELFHLGEAFWDAIGEDLLAVTSSEVVYNQIDVFKADGSDVGNSGFYTILSADGTGAGDGAAMPPFVTWTYQYTRPSSNFRHGYKRFAGVEEDNVDDGVATDAARVFLDALAVTLRGDIGLNDAGVNRPFMQPALVQRVKEGIPVDPDVWYAPSTIQYKLVGSQNTRKYGRGS